MPHPQANPRLDRRHFSRLAAAGVVAFGTTTRREVRGQQAAAWQPLNRFPRMMQRFLVSQVTEAHQRSVDAKAALRTRVEAEAYVQEVRAKIAESFGAFPERTPLEPRVTGRVEREEYVIDKVIFHSRPNFPVTANLYLPRFVVEGESAKETDSPKQVPGVVGTCGHSSNGKAAEAYQSYAQALAKLGYACLIYDPIGQGERLQYPNQNGRSKVGVGVREHIQAGNQQFLVGENLSAWRAWDGIRALDYLLTRPEVDHQHLGVTGNSGGGTMTTWLCGVESRWTMAAPSCFVTEFLRNAENELPADTEQCPPKALALGLEHEDFLAALAPKPVIILAKERDYFDVRGSQAAYQRLKRLYELLGHPENIALHIGPTPHGYSIENREAMYRWFQRATGSDDLDGEPNLQIEKDEVLWCTESGQVAELQPATVPSLTAATARQLSRARGDIPGDALEKRIQETLKLPSEVVGQPPRYRILRDMGRRDYPLPRATTYAIETEPGVFALSYLLRSQPHYSRPPAEGPAALLYVAHRSSDDELRQQVWLRDLVTNYDAGPIFTCDVRGVGESLPNTCGKDSFDDAYGCDYFYAIHGLMLDRPYLGQKTWDVLSTLAWLKAYGYTRIDLVGNGWGSLSATFAALLCPEVTRLQLKNEYESYLSIATSELYDMPLAYVLPNVLDSFDLPDCYAELKRRGVLV